MATDDVDDVDDVDDADDDDDDTNDNATKCNSARHPSQFEFAFSSSEPLFRSG